MKKHPIRTMTAAVLVMCFMLVSPASGGMLEPDCERAQHASGSEIAVDLILIRPILLGVTVIGTGFFIVTAPFTLIGRNFTHSAEVMVAEPAVYTFGYPLGSY